MSLSEAELLGDVRQRLDTVVSRYSPLRDPSAAPPAPVRAATPVPSGPSPLTARRVAAG